MSLLLFRYFSIQVCGLAIPTAFMLLVTLTIRACMESGGPLGITALMAPNWDVMTQPSVWMEAVAQVVLQPRSS